MRAPVADSTANAYRVYEYTGKSFITRLFSGASTRPFDGRAEPLASAYRVSNPGYRLNSPVTTLANNLA